MKYYTFNLKRYGPVVLIFLALLVTNCAFRPSTKPSVFVLAFESLPSSVFDCQKSSDTIAAERSGVHTLCEESVRFTHAYTTSPLGAPALVSILTGRYPFEHGVWHNGNQFLSGKFETVAEAAVKQGYRTLFISGGPPIWRKSGISQGFESFEDNVPIQVDKYYRPIEENLKILTDWIGNEATAEPVFTVVTNEDLIFPAPHYKQQPEVIPTSMYNQQLNSVQEALRHFFDRLRNMGLWDSSYIVIVGLNGIDNRNRPTELKGFNLFSENTRVALFIKSPHSSENLEPSKTVDANVTLADLGATLFQWVGSTPPRRSDHVLEVVSLDKAIAAKPPDLDSNRPILAESAWAQWHSVGKSRFSLRIDNYLFLFDKEMTVYNTLTDRMEEQPLREHDPNLAELVEKAGGIFQRLGVSRFEGLPQLYIDKVNLGSILESQHPPDKELETRFQNLLKKMPWDSELIEWWASLAFEQKNWLSLKNLGETSHRPEWVFLAGLALNESIQWPRTPCIRLLRHSYKKFAHSSAKTCDEFLFVLLLSWIKQPEDSHLEKKYQDEFLVHYLYNRIDQDILKLDYLNGLVWDVSARMIRGPTNTDIVLLHPDYREYQQIVVRQLLPNMP